MGDGRGEAGDVEAVGKIDEEHGARLVVVEAPPPTQQSPAVGRDHALEFLGRLHRPRLLIGMLHQELPRLVGVGLAD